MQELVGDGVALVMGQEHAVARELAGIAPGHDVDQQAAVGDPVEGRGHARGGGRLLKARAHGYEEAQVPRQGGERRGDHPGILAGAPVGSSTPK